ncbi:MAG TPA: hypothetical protein VMH47_05245 [Gaiellaceae bacterium]|nr:hypothetical protein [Gaiellaceae bacterium]
MADPPHAGRVARWTRRAHELQRSAEAARTRHATLDFGFGLAERDSSIGGGLLAGALAYRLFVLLLPTALLLVSGLGIYSGSVDKSPQQVAREAGLHGLIGSEVAQTASGRARWLVFLVMIPVVLYALTTLYRAIAKVYAIVWLGSARGVPTAPAGIGVLGAAFAVQMATGPVVHWVSGYRFGYVLAFVVYVLLIGGAWLAVSLELPHARARWPALLPGAALFGVGLLGVSVFNIYVTSRLVEGRANTYGALGIATALLFSLVLVGRLIVTSAEVNVALSERRTPPEAPRPPEPA